MALTLITTPGAINANSFSSLVEANAYHETILNPEVWTNATEDKQNRGLAQATRVLSLLVRWKGVPSSPSQALPWPRRGVLTQVSADGGGTSFHNRYIQISGGLLSPLGVELPTDEIPQFLKDATSEFGRVLIESDRVAEQDSGNVSSIEIPGLTVGYLGSGSDSKRKFIPPQIYQMIAFYVDTMMGYTARRVIRS